MKPMTDREFNALLALYTGSLIVAGLLVPAILRADELDDTAMAVAQEYACEWAAPASLAPVLAMGIPSDMAIEIVADEAWQIVLTTTPDAICPEVRMADAGMAGVRLDER